MVTYQYRPGDEYRSLNQIIKRHERTRQDTLGAVVFGTEFVALATGVVPTWSSHVKRLPVWARVLAWAGVSLWLFDHWITGKRF